MHNNVKNCKVVQDIGSRIVYWPQDQSSASYQFCLLINKECMHNFCTQFYSYIIQKGTTKVKMVEVVVIMKAVIVEAVIVVTKKVNA